MCKISILLVKVNFHLAENGLHCHVFETEKGMKSWGLMQGELVAAAVLQLQVQHRAAQTHPATRQGKAVILIIPSDFLPAPGF